MASLPLLPCRRDVGFAGQVLWEFVWEGIPWPYPHKVVDAGLAMQDPATGFFSRNSDGTAGDPMVTPHARLSARSLMLRYCA